MDLLACPICKHFPLKLTVIKRNMHRGERLDASSPSCEIYCGYLDSYIKNIGDPPCKDCIDYEIVVGILTCPKCLRWYPIEEEIPRMLPDELRDAAEDKFFLKKYEHYISREILAKGKPFNLSPKSK